MDGPPHFSSNVPTHALGPTVARDRCLADMGLRLLVVPWFEWQAMQVGDGCVEGAKGWFRWQAGEGAVGGFLEPEQPQSATGWPVHWIGGGCGCSGAGAYPCQGILTWGLTA